MKSTIGEVTDFLVNNGCKSLVFESVDEKPAVRAEINCRDDRHYVYVVQAKNGIHKYRMWCSDNRHGIALGYEKLYPNTNKKQNNDCITFTELKSILKSTIIQYHKI